MSHTGVQLAPLRVTVLNANLKFVRHPIVVGHYRSMALTGTELATDQLIGGAMSTALRMGLYPDLPGSHQVFKNTVANHDNPMQPPRPDAVIVVGLGEEGKLRAPDLATSVRQGVMAWAQQLVGDAELGKQPFELAATLIGSGGTGNPAGQAARLVAQGVRDANVRLIEAKWPTVKHLYLVELFLDRATEAWRALQILTTSSPGEYAVTPFLQSGLGALQRPLEPSYRGSEYDLISAVTQQDSHGESLISYTVDTRRARTEVRAQATQLKLLRELTTSAASDESTDKQIGRSLFRLLVPLEMQPFLAGSDAMLLELDSGTAGIPWELLDASTGMERGGPPTPWAIRTKLLRKLRTVDFRAQVQDVNADAHVLVIGEPKCDDPTLPRLPAAREEAREVADLFTAQIKPATGLVKRLICGPGPRDVGPDARTVINSLLERDWRIIHITGHGEPPDRPTSDASKSGMVPVALDPRGVVLSSGTYLGPREIATMAVVPELVFVNCCYSAVGDPERVLEQPDASHQDRSRFAAGVAQELIRIGVRCVIATGWAVEDEQAMTFAKVFYQHLLQGTRFMDAVAEAREAAWRKKGNTWAAYQCYGDPDWRFRQGSSLAQQTARTPEDKYSGVASWRVLLLALEAIAVDSRYKGYDKDQGREALRYLETRFKAEWGAIGAVAQAFGLAWTQIGDSEAAIAWYRVAVSANDGSASMKAVHELANLRARVALLAAESAQREVGTTGDAATATAAIAAARTEILSAIGELEKITEIHRTIEGESLCGSALKRLAMLEALAGDSAAEMAAIARVKARYGNAEVIARSIKHPQLFYPTLNRMAAELNVEACAADWGGFNAETINEVRESLTAKTRDDPDFWSVVGVTELRLYEALANRALASALDGIMGEYRELYERVSAPLMWSSVYDQARWVVAHYVSRVGDDEDAAAFSLLNQLSQLASAT